MISALFICKPPLYWTKPFFLKALINLLTLARVVPTISARVAWLTFRGCSGFDSFIYLSKQQQNACQSLFAEIEELIYQVFLDSNNSGKQICIKQRCELAVSLERANRALLPQPSDTGLSN
jgi:hypothetical protein